MRRTRHGAAKLRAKSSAHPSSEGLYLSGCRFALLLVSRGFAGKLALSAGRCARNRRVCSPKQLICLSAIALCIHSVESELFEHRDGPARTGLVKLRTKRGFDIGDALRTTGRAGTAAGVEEKRVGLTAMLKRKPLVVAQVLKQRIRRTRSAEASLGAQGRLKARNALASLGATRSRGGTEEPEQVSAIVTGNPGGDTNLREHLRRRARSLLTKLCAKRSLDLRDTLATSLLRRTAPMLPITHTLGVKRRPHQVTPGVDIAQAAVEIVAIAFREPWFKTQLEEHRTRRTRRRTSELDAERSAKARDTSTSFAFGWVAPCPLALGRLRALLGNDSTLFDIALVEGPLAIQVGSRDAKRTGEDARASGGGSSQFGLKPGAYRRAHRLTLLTAQVDEPAVSIGAGTQQERASGTEGARNGIGRQTARGAKRCVQSRLGAAHKGRVSGQDTRLNECAQPGVQIRAMLSQGRFAHTAQRPAMKPVTSPPAAIAFSSAFRARSRAAALRAEM